MNFPAGSGKEGSSPQPEESPPWELLRALPHRIAVLDSRGVAQFVSPAWELAKRLSPDPLLNAASLGMSFFSACAPAAAPFNIDTDRLVASLNAMLAGGNGGFVTEYETRSGGQGRLHALHAAAHGSQDRRILVLTHMEAPPQPGWFPARDSSSAPPDGLLRQQRPDDFVALVSQYADCLRAAVELLAFRLPDRVRSGARALAALFYAFGAGPRDVVDIQTAALAECGRKLTGRMYTVYRQEAPMLLLEVMGCLAAHYRNRAIGSCTQCREEGLRDV